MDRFEYDVTVHPAAAFRKVVYFCTETGECTLDRVPGEETRALAGLLNERGQVGWELVQVAFGKDGILAFWRRRVQEK